MKHNNALKSKASSLTMVFTVIILFTVLSIATSSFLRTGNLLNILRQISINGIISVSMTMVALTGGIDLSVGSMIAFSGILTAGLLTGTALPIPVVILISISVSVVMGAINGYLIAVCKAPEFAVTLAMMTVGRGITYLYCDGKPISSLPDDYLAIGKGSIFGIPIPFLIFMVVFAVFAVMLKRMRFGRYIYAVGGNPHAAMVSGVSVKKVIMSVYIISGICCGIAANVLTARVSAGLPTAGEGYELDAIAATVIGGTSLAGGRGHLWGTLLGVFLLGMVNNGMDLLGVTSYYQQVIKGVIILFAVLVDARITRKSNS